MGTIHTLFDPDKPPTDAPPRPRLHPNDILGDCSWCNEPVALKHALQDGPNLVCSKCLIKDVMQSAWDSERCAIWHVLKHPFVTALGAGVRVYLESVARPHVTYAETFAYLSELKSMLDAAPHIDQPTRQRAEASLHEARAMMAEFLEHRRR